jgi:hypothetical protein
LPCRGFAAAIAAVSSGGEVVVLDSAGYGPASIDKSLAIVAPKGVYAGVTSSSLDPNSAAIFIDGANAHVALRGLALRSGSGSGIIFAQGEKLEIRDCIVENMVHAGIAAIAPASSVSIVDSVIRGNGGSGIDIADTTATLLRVRSERNGGGIAVRGKSNLEIVDGIVAHNVFGITVWSVDATSPASVSVDQTTISDQAVSGIDVHVTSGGSVTVRVSASVVLRGIAGVTAVVATGQAAVRVLDSHLADFQTTGVNLDGAGARLFVSGNTIMSDNGTGISLSNGASAGSGVNNRIDVPVPVSGALVNAPAY